LDDESAYTLHGKVPYAASGNIFYHQSKNVEKLLEENKALRIIPHRVNSIGKLRDVQASGFVGLELDLIYGLNGNDTFTVSHDASDGSDLTFEAFLSLVSTSPLEKIWFDLKNMNSENHRSILKRLNTLNESFSFKERLILETSETANFMAAFTQDGWHTSYYLPTQAIFEAFVGNNIEVMDDMAKNIADQSERQQVSAVSFDKEIYPFVKTYLEPLLSDTVVYHTWDLTIKLYDKDLDDKLNGQTYYKDDRVKTILLPYKSHFSL
jgi:hypothetical protein